MRMKRIQIIEKGETSAEDPDAGDLAAGEVSTVFTEASGASMGDEIPPLPAKFATEHC